MLDIFIICKGWALKTYDDGVARIKRCKRLVEEISNPSLVVLMKLGDQLSVYRRGNPLCAVSANDEKVLGSAQAVGLTLSKSQSLCCVNGSVGISRVDLCDKRYLLGRPLTN